MPHPSALHANYPDPVLLPGAPPAWGLPLCFILLLCPPSLLSYLTLELTDLSSSFLAVNKRTFYLWWIFSLPASEPMGSQRFSLILVSPKAASSTHVIQSIFMSLSLRHYGSSRPHHFLCSSQALSQACWNCVSVTSQSGWKTMWSDQQPHIKETEPTSGQACAETQ